MLRKPIDFYPKPRNPITPERYIPWLKMLQFSDSSYAELARKRLNVWLSNWDQSDLKDIQNRLHSPLESQRNGALAELYINAYMKSIGLKVTRIKSDIKGQSNPDFLVQNGKQTFYLEATSISRIDPSFEKNWQTLVKAIDKVILRDCLLSVQARNFTNKSAPSTKIAAEIRTWAESFSAENIQESFQNLNFYTRRFAMNGWEIEVTILPRTSHLATLKNVVMESKSKSIFITDGEDLKSKLEEKRKCYPHLEYPLVLFVAEQSIFGAIDPFHRIEALYGRQQVVINLEYDETENGFEPVGIWGRRRYDTKLSAVILMAMLDVSQETLPPPQIWLNPHTNSKWLVNKFLLPTAFFANGNLNFCKNGLVWDGLENIGASLRTKIRSILLAEMRKFKKCET
jgi:hypothetical protein